MRHVKGKIDDGLRVCGSRQRSPDIPVWASSRELVKERQECPCESRPVHLARTLEGHPSRCFLPFLGEREPLPLNPALKSGHLISRK